MPVMEKLQQWIEDDKNVLIYDKNGSNFAGACVCAWLMWKEGLSAEDALAVAKDLRWKIYVDNKLFNLLEQFEIALTSGNF